MSLNKLGRYDILRVLGKGAMGLVYEARDPNLNRRVAIKTIKVENLSQDAAAEYEARFKTEAHSAARLQHPNIVSVYDSDRHGDMAFLVMEFIQGEDLKHHLDAGARYSLAQSLAMMGELLSALDYAHRQSIVHRDIKPANLLIEADGRLKLTDFGVARIEDSGEATRTQGSMVGTIKYMSPEQVQGQPIDARADLFAVGIVLYQLLTGQRPFDGDTDFAIIQQIVNAVPAPPRSINPLLPPEIDAVLARALAKNRNERFASAAEFAQALQEASGQASDPTIVPPLSPPGRRAGKPTDSGQPGARTSGSTVRLAASDTGTGSTVTQELELVYWKDIKESEDRADLQGFLDRFPSGIYADLARRRLRKLGGSPADEPSTSATPTTETATETEWTRLQRQHGSAAVAAPDSAGAQATLLTGSGVQSGLAATAGAPPAEPDSPAVAPARALPAPAPAVRSSTAPLYAVAGVAVLVLAGLAFKFLSGPAAAGGDAVASSPAAALAAGEGPVLPSGTRAATTVVPVVATEAEAAAKAASAPKRVVARPAAEAGGPPTPAAGRAAAADSAPASADARSTAQTGPAHPRQACENRVLVGFQICMNEQCAAPRFQNHPVCVERREQEKMRQDIRDGRQ